VRWFPCVGGSCQGSAAALAEDVPRTGEREVCEAKADRSGITGDGRATFLREFPVDGDDPAAVLGRAIDGPPIGHRLLLIVCSVAAEAKADRSGITGDGRATFLRECEAGERLVRGSAPR
jgi:hypothetical protein